jgi:uncharacterized protein DUF1572
MHAKDFFNEYARYRSLGEKALAQVPDAALNRIPAPDGNSIAMLVRHIGGNLASRFTDFLTTDGEKPWRDRDGEFAEGPFTRAQIDEVWKKGWDIAEGEVGKLNDDDFGRTITIRGTALTVHEALCRSIAHTSMHVGQIILLARMYATSEWQTLSIPKGKSQDYNKNPVLEKSHVR